MAFDPVHLVHPKTGVVVEATTAVDLTNFRFNDGYGFSRGRFLSRFSGTFCLMVSLGFSWSADNLAGNDFSHCHGSGYF